MIKRCLHDYIKVALESFPAVALLGPRQVGKTTLSFELTKAIHPSPIYLDLEKPSDRTKLADAESYLTQYSDRLVILDEIQRFPDLFEILRSLIDQRKRNGSPAGHYLLLGSASKDLLQQSSESLAGRINYIELSGFNVEEVGQSHLNDLWLRGGFPDSFLAKNEEISFNWRDALIKTYLEREIPNFGPRIPAETLRRFWTMLSYNQGELLNSARLASSLGVSNPTITRYLDLLVDLFMVRILRPWSNNLGKRLVKTPKIYIRDSGLAHALLGIRTMDHLLSHPIVGHSWEGFIIENIESVLNNKINLFFYRTSAGAEVDLLIEHRPGQLIAVEIKKSLTPTITKSLHEAIATLNPWKTFIIYSGSDQYRLSNEVEVISLSRFLDFIQNLDQKS